MTRSKNLAAVINSLSVSVLIIFCATTTFGSIRLPLLSLRDQGHTVHCWAYAMSYMLESRGLLRDSSDFVIDVERKTMYWVDYERLLAIYRTHADVALPETENGWQIEYWDALMKHGLALYSSEPHSPDVVYPIQNEYDKSLGFLAAPPFVPPVPPLSLAAERDELLQQKFSDESQASAFILRYLDQRFGKPEATTLWMDHAVAQQTIPSLLLGSDYQDSSLIVIKPADDGDYKWVKYLGGRFWSYRYPRKQILSLIRRSLDSRWPVSFDDGNHATTLLGYETAPDDTYYAVADSDPGFISWYPSRFLEKQLNAVTFFEKPIQSVLPPKPSELDSRDLWNVDKRDGMDRPLH